MAMLWQNAQDDSWLQIALDREPVTLGPSIDAVDRDALRALNDSVALYPHVAGAGAVQWLLLAPLDAGVVVNDQALATGVRLIADRDAIRLPGQSELYFSAERLARIETYSGNDPVYCPRCKIAIAEGDAAVCCPQCAVWHHEDVGNDRTCWTYANTCALCDQPSALDRPEYQWTPGSL